MRHKMNQPGKPLGVIGLGGLGHMAVKFGKALGLKVKLFSTSTSKTEEALNLLGVDKFVVSFDQDQMKVAGVYILVGFPSEVKFSPASVLIGAKTVSGSAWKKKSHMIGNNINLDFALYCSASSKYINPSMSNKVRENYRPLANFRPSIWKDTFDSMPSPKLVKELEYDKQFEELKEQVKETLSTAFSTDDPVKEVILINSLCRLGVSYHFKTEIEQRLHHIFESHPDLAAENDYDLYTVALIFRVFRQHGFKMSCGVFNKFKESDGKFKESLISDVRGILSLYEATQLRVHEEDILEEALIFTTTHLKKISLALDTSPQLANYVTKGLEQPFHTGVPRLEAIKYISFYEHEESRNEALLKFAKLDFNHLQLLHKQELSYLTSWWKDLNFASIYFYMRDRLVEIYLWSIAQHYEPCYSRARLIVTKIVMMMMAIDDTYDAYGLLDELRCFTDAIERWDIDALNQLPNYLKPLYKSLLNLFEELNNEVTEEGRSYSVSFIKEMVKEVVRAYFVEAQWFREGFVPLFDEHMSNALISACCVLLPAAAFTGIREIAGIHAFEWLQSKPKVMMSSFTILRLIADLVSHEDEQKRGHVASVVESYMKEYGTSRMETAEKFKIMVTNLWKDINEECMRPKIIPLQLINVIVNVARIAEVFYKEVDGVTNPEYVKDYVKKLFVDPLPL
ncbi:Terpene synthase [Melia azedarach]|uniref:Terpene synthase n=1 Tax=Melia azedarach TaxID=155640 RepID=A0ACC1YLT5_MELAZ|nr:Terpene synthase [Melia azedarach]